MNPSPLARSAVSRGWLPPFLAAVLVTVPTARAATEPGAGHDGPARGAPSCAEAASVTGRTEGETTGDLEIRLDGEAFFSLVDRASGGHALQITLTEPQLGRWQMRFEVPGLQGLPKTGDLAVAAADSSATRTATGTLYVFDAAALAGRNLVPRSGILSLDAVGEDGVCGRFDVIWQGPQGSGLRELRARGTFEAVDSGLGGPASSTGNR